MRSSTNLLRSTTYIVVESTHYVVVEERFHDTNADLLAVGSTQLPTAPSLQVNHPGTPRHLRRLSRRRARSNQDARARAGGHLGFCANHTDTKIWHGSVPKQILAILDSDIVPASSWTDTEQYRSEIRRDQEVLKKLDAAR
jgi:hypothetical protein